MQPAGNYYDKYHTRNPIARALMRGFLGAFEHLAQKAGPVGRALEIGCGEGELSMRLSQAGWQIRGCDIAPEAVAEARRRAMRAGLDIPFAVKDIFDDPTSLEPANLVVCCEVLEHLDDPDAAVRILSQLSRQYVLVSVPREPLWRALNLARGRYIRDMGNTPGHVQHWSAPAFLAMLDRHLDVVETRFPLPWTMVLCRVRRA